VKALRSLHLSALVTLFSAPSSRSAPIVDSDVLQNDIRVAQSLALIRQMPMIVAGNGLGSLIGYFALASVDVDRILIILPFVMWLALAPMYLSWARLRNQAPPKTVSPRRIHMIVAYSGALGVLWAALEAYYLPATPFEVAAFLITGCAFLTIGAVAALSTIPWACVAYAAPMIITATVIAANQSHPAHQAITMLLVLTSVGLIWFLRQNWTNFSALMLALLRERQLREEHAFTQVELQKANERLSALAATDSLTGLPNRRQLDHTLASEWRRARRASKPISLLMIDIDHFKEINDLVGHAGGDACLRSVAKTILANVKRSSDLAARYGGDEFAAILPETREGEALVVAENIRSAVEALQLGHRTTVSVGMTTARPNGPQAPEDALATADQALFEAKQRGRNICVAKR
jgi:diguanylate cyclase (GGDEF)-like protein